MITPSPADREPETVDQDAADRVGTTPPKTDLGVGWGAVEWGRWTWRQITSMRTALLLLFLLAVAAVPGSLLPQRTVDPGAVAAYGDAHPQLAPILDRLRMFDVYSSPWFSAVYLLLMVSLVGCLVPRTLHHAAALRRLPPPPPRHLDRLSLYESWSSPGRPSDVLAVTAGVLRRRRYRVLVETDVVRAEKGRLRETGNLAFHLALLGVLAGVAVSSLYGLRGEALIVEGGRSFANQPGDYDTLNLGRLATTTGLPPFTVRLDDFSADYQQDGAQVGAPTSFRAVTRVRPRPGAAEVRRVVAVNHPLSVDGMKLFLTGHGYAPVVVVRDASGQVVYDDASVFLPKDGWMTSTGVVKVTDARPQQLGLSGVFLPTAALDRSRGPVSVFPAARRPMLFLTGYAGSLGIDGGQPQSVYRLDTTAMTQLRSGGKVWTVALRPGQTAPLPGGRGSVTFAGLREFAAFKVARDPGGGIVLASVVVALAGLVIALVLPQQRLWVRVGTGPTHNDSTVQFGGLSRRQTSGNKREFEQLARSLQARTPEPEPAQTRTDVPVRS